MKKLNKLRLYVFQIGLTYVLVELICFVMIATQYIPANYPAFSFDLFKDVIVADVNPYWGNWHPYQTALLKKGNCIEMQLHFNSVGCRDKEREKQGAENRIIMLGDSYIEGYGIEEKERLSNLLENELQKEVLNFGCSGLGFVQEYLVYQHLAKDYTHQTILLGLMPNNDFIDSDIALQKKAGLGHYKPYFTGDYPSCVLTHWVNELSDSPYEASKIRGWKRTSVRLLKSFTFWFNIFYYFQYIKPEIDANNEIYSGFYDYTPAQLESLKCSLQALKEAAPQKKIIIFTIPNEIDFAYYSKKGNSPLQTALADFCKNIDIQYLDLLQIWYQQKNTNVKALYIPCDGHWSAKANQEALKTLLPLLK